MIQRCSVPSISALMALKNHQIGEIVHCLGDNKDYIWTKDKTWKVKEQPKVEVSLYDLNKSIISQGKPLSLTEISKKMKLIEELHHKNYNKHYMLLSNENHYYTVFDNDTTLSFPTFDGAVCDVISNLGEVFSIEKTKDKKAIEIWIKLKKKEDISVFYLFPYDSGVVYYG